MSVIELVIRIPEDEYQNILLTGKASFRAVNAIEAGTPLPKRHGRLIDANDLDVITITTDDYSGNDVLDLVLKEDIDDAPTIIEADKTESEE